MKAADDERVRRHELTKGVCCLIALVAGTFFGLSPLILAHSSGGLLEPGPQRTCSRW